MNTEKILSVFAENQVDYLLIGGMNFLLRHQPVLTFDVDLWVRDEMHNLAKVNAALTELQAQWGQTEQQWAAVPSDPAWLQRQEVYCLTTAFGAVDIFRKVRGLEGFDTCLARSSLLHTQAGTPFRSLSDQDMLRCQLALAETDRRQDRVTYLQRILASS